LENILRGPTADLMLYHIVV